MAMVSGNGRIVSARRMPAARPVRAARETRRVSVVPHHRPMTRVLRGVAMTVRGDTPAHADLRSRVLGVTLVSIAVDVVAACIAWAFEHGHGEITTFGNALFWTTTQLLTVSSQFPNPLTTGGKALDVVLELYAIVVVTSVAGAFASFFHHRTLERREHEAKPPG
jgi:hypothetical protein